MQLANRGGPGRGRRPHHPGGERAQDDVAWIRSYVLEERD